jgi:hypothetical protein
MSRSLTQQGQLPGGAASGIPLLLLEGRAIEDLLRAIACDGGQNFLSRAICPVPA